MSNNPPASATGSGGRTAQETCFVVMGFGKKTDFETGRLLDLDMSYKDLIKPAVQAVGLKCVRADEIVQSGLIDVAKTWSWLIFRLQIRTHSMSSGSGMPCGPIPRSLSRKSRCCRQRHLLTAAIQTIIARQPQPDVDSPVYRFIAQLNPPRIGAKAEISATNDSKQPPPQMDSVDHIGEMQEVGRALGQQKVKSEHFTGFPAAS